MISVSVWRARIGSFFCSSARKSKGQFRQWRKTASLHEKNDNHKASVTDILLFYTLLCVIFAAVVIVIVNTRNFSSNFDHCIDSQVLVQNYCSPTACEFTVKTVKYVPEITNNTSSILVSVVNCVFTITQILLSGDVQLNPGPQDQEKRLKEMVDKLEKQMIDKISLLENQMSKVLAAVQSQADSLRTIVEGQNQIQQTIAKISQEVSETKEIASRNTSAIQDIYGKQEETDKLIADLEDEIDRLEGFSRRNNIKFFGIPEAEANGKEDPATVVQDILNTHIPQKSWPSDTIERAHRLGRPDSRNHRPRPVIAKFQRWGDAMQLMNDREARDKMYEKGLRVSQDLTKRQSATLRALRDEGKVGYYLRGKLHIKDQPRSTSDRRNYEQRSITRDSNTRQRNTRDSRDDTPRNRPISSEEKRSDQTATFTHAEQHGAGAKPRTRSTTTGERQASLHEAWGTCEQGSTDKRT